MLTDWASFAIGVSSSKKGITNFLNDDPYSVEDTNNSILKTGNYQSELIVLIGDFKSLDYEFKNFCDIWFGYI